MTTLTTLAIITALEIFALMSKHRLVYYLAGFAWAIFGFTYYATSHYLGVILVLFGGYNIIRGATV